MSEDTDAFTFELYHIEKQVVEDRSPANTLYLIAQPLHEIITK